MTGIYARHAPEYIEAGLPCFPVVDTQNKTPAVKGWQTPTVRKSRAWGHTFPDAAGIGVIMGPQSRITEVDVDTVGDAALAEALERFGPSPVTIRTASGKSKIWYRHNGERRLIGPVPGIDVLGGGFTIAPPTWREDMGASYRFLTGSLSDLGRLPTIREGALPTSARSAGSIQQGERNNRLFLYAMEQARTCDDVEALLDVCATLNEAMPDPLPAAEVEKTARSAWQYQAEDRNYVGLKRPQVRESDVVMDALIDAPEAFSFYHLLHRWHRPGETFAIAPAAMSLAGNPPWPKERIKRARDVLLERGSLIVVTAPDASRRRAGRYRLV